MVLHLAGLDPTFHIVFSASSVGMIFLNFTEVAMTYHKAQYMELGPFVHILYYSSHFTHFIYFLVVTQSPPVR